MATIADEIRAAIKDIRGDGLTPEEIYSKCPSATSADQISIHMSAFVKRDEAIRTTVQGQRAGRFRLNSQYRPARGQEEDDNGARLVKDSAHDEKDKPGPKPRTAFTGDRKPGQKNKKKQKARLTKKPRMAAKKPVGKKRKYTRRAPPQRPSAPAASDPRPAGAPRASDFAINEDGDLGISAGQNKIALGRAEVQRLQGFLKTTAPLWQ